MMHQPSQAGGGGTAADIEIQAREIMYLRGKVNGLMARHTGRPVEQLERDFDRDYYMSAEEAKAYGIVDAVVARRGDLVDASAQPAATA
jgi:ATP-dependent Clp protease protease subunit